MMGIIEIRVCGGDSVIRGVLSGSSRGRVRMLMLWADI
jgi:hypothetical protein